MISRFYDPQTAFFFISLPPDRRRRLVADGHACVPGTEVSFVFQGGHLFSDTVRGKIAYGPPAPDRRRIEAAARLAPSK